MQNSFVAPMAVANALLNGVAAAVGERAIERYDRLYKLVNRWDTFLLKGDDGE
jgi:DNA-binding MurR/RpiR family transcriptional regulator